MAATRSSRKTATSKVASSPATKGKTSIASSITGKVEAFLPDAATPSSSATRKRKHVVVEILESVYEGTPPRSTKKAKKGPVEKRQKLFRKKAPQTFLEKLERAQNQRMIVIGRTRSSTDACPTEDIDIVGSTGNIYTVTIDQVPSCTCPDSQKGNECKHKVYALATVLRAPYELQYQRALLTSELKTIFANAPPIPTDVADNEDKDGTRKPVEGECPICYMDFEEESNELVWCKAACGNNVHKTCFKQWAASQRGNTVKCVYCRTPWEMDSKDMEAIKSRGTVNEDGYVNVAEHFDMSGVRDYSTYHPYWVRQTLGMGW